MNHLCVKEKINELNYTAYNLDWIAGILLTRARSENDVMCQRFYTGYRYNIIYNRYASSNKFYYHYTILD